MKKGHDTAAMIHGTVESILLARATSSAPALHGLAKMELIGSIAGEPGWKVVPVAESDRVCKSDGDRYGEEKDKR